MRTADQVLDGDGRGQLAPNEAESMRTALEDAQEWLALRGEDLAEERVQISREAQAIRLLADSIEASQRSEWSLAASLAERLLSSFDDTLVVLLLSDGSAWRAADRTGTPADH